MSINDLFSATLNSLRRGSMGRREERAKAAAASDISSGDSGGGGGVGEWTNKQVRRYFKRLQLDEYVGALRRAKIDGARLVALHNQDRLYATLGVTKIGHKKKLMVALRSLQEQGAWPYDPDTVQPLKHVDSLRSSTATTRSFKARGRATTAAAAAATTAELDQQHNRSMRSAAEGTHNRDRKNERTGGGGVVVIGDTPSGAPSGESMSPTKNASPPPEPELPMPDWAKLQRSRSGPDDARSLIDGAGDSLSPRPATTRSSRTSPRQPHSDDAIWRSAPRAPLVRDLSSSSLPIFGSSVVATAAVHDTASHSPATSMPVSPAGSHIINTFTWPQSELSFTAPTTVVRQGQQRQQCQQAVSACTTLAYSQAFGGVAVKCVFGDDVSMIRINSPGQASDCDTSTESGDDSDSDDDDAEGDTQKQGKLHFANLRETIKTTYGRPLRVKYVDRDGDAINIDSDASLNYAFNDWRGQLGEGSGDASTTASTTSWRLYLSDFDESSPSSLSSSSSTVYLSSSSSSFAS